MNVKYLSEINDFSQRFKNYKNARIVLYGIGRYTATLLEGAVGFHFVGLMDKDPSNIGKVFFGLPVMDIPTAEKNADMVIINTSETYWSLIYNRIQDMEIPVYYKNGTRAEKKEAICQNYPYGNLTCENMCSAICSSQVVSFDFFDTLFMRCVCNPGDVFQLLERELETEWGAGVSYTEIRNRAKKKFSGDYSLDELYVRMEALSGVPHLLLDMAKQKEILLEKKLLVPRREVLDGLRLALEAGKEVYIISDMYLPEAFYTDVLSQYALHIPRGHILLSNVLHRTKADGTMWRYYTEQVVKGRKALHIGDNRQADIEEAQKWGLETYTTPGAWDMLAASSMNGIVPDICSLYASAVSGCILKELCQNPFSQGQSNGVVHIVDNRRMGYCVFGPVVLTFLLWLLERCRLDHIGKLVFLARDGYFLKENFEYLCTLMHEEHQACYLGISRQLAMTASIQNRQDLLEYAFMPYSGTIPELLEDRFDIHNASLIPQGRLEDYIERHMPQIQAYVSRVRDGYLTYIEQLQLHNGCAVVDLGYYGNNQKYLNKLAGLDMTGYYFNANLSAQNINAQIQGMRACFQEGSDPSGADSCILKKQIFLESFLTAPYGMVKAVDGDGQFFCAPDGKNQECFRDKEEINRGVKEFIGDYWRLFGSFGLKQDAGFIDSLYGLCFGGGLTFADDVKKSFFNDNALMHRFDSMVFY